MERVYYVAKNISWNKYSRVVHYVEKFCFKLESMTLFFFLWLKLVQINEPIKPNHAEQVVTIINVDSDWR